MIKRHYKNILSLLEIESEIPIYRMRRRCFIRPYRVAFSFVFPCIDRNLAAKLLIFMVDFLKMVHLHDNFTKKLLFHVKFLHMVIFPWH
jgi:hypothetical protein